MIVVSDASPLVAFIELDRLDVLPALFGEVVVPQAVYDELRHLTRFYEQADRLLTARWLQIRTVRRRDDVNFLLERVNLGEAEAIVLCEELAATLLLIDERAGRQVAHERSIAHTGTLGVLRQAKQTGLMAELKPAIDVLRERLQFRLSDVLVAEFLSSVNE
jgi:predicted nucleic acid-binding protein